MIKKFEDIKAWQKARNLNKGTTDAIRNKNFSEDWFLKNQLLKCCDSIMLNIAEGFGRNSPAEFKQYLVIAHGSVTEIQSGLYIALDRKYISVSNFEDLYSDAEDVSKLISGFIRHLKSKIEEN